MTENEDKKPGLTQEETETTLAIEKCREIVKRKSKEIGRPLTYCTVTFGCQMYAETEI